MKEKFLLKIIILSVISVFSACQKTNADKIGISPSPTVSIVQPVNQKQTPKISSPIRNFDFKNFTYPDPGGYEGFKLINGKKLFVHRETDGIDLNNIKYLDANNDGEEDAILFMSVQIDGSMIPEIIYIYALRNKRPKLLWSFMAGDRANGGLKEIYLENDGLIVELFGENKYLDGNWESHIPKDKLRGDCCPSLYTKTRFKWNGKKFVVHGNPELFDYDENKEVNEQ